MEQGQGQGQGREGALHVLLLLASLVATGGGLLVGAPCQLDEGEGEGLGRCELLPACRSAMELLKRGGRPKLCGFQDGKTSVPNVCCAQRPEPEASKQVLGCGAEARSYPLPGADRCAGADLLARPKPTIADGSGSGSAARRACRSYERDVCRLKPLQPKGVSPSEAEQADKMEFPHMALLGYGEELDSIEFACGGSLISSDFVLTAAHCTALRRLPVRWALLGALSRSSGFHLESDEQLIGVVEIISHPGYHPRQRYDDIALLRLQRPALLSREGVRPACLHTEEDGDPTNLEAIATGWGATGYAEDVSENLLKVDLTIRSLDVCRRNISTGADPKLPRGIVDTQLCAGGGSGRDTCQGDSGGPLQVAAATTGGQACLYRVIGVVSFGPACGIGLPAVYTRVAAYVPWIESVVWPTASNSCTLLPYTITSDPIPGVSVPNTGPGSVARRMCRAFLFDWCHADAMEAMQPGVQLRDQCHYKLRGPAADLDHYPHLAMLSYGEHIHNSESGCTASLIHPSYLLTTASCTSLACLPVRRALLGLVLGREMLNTHVMFNFLQTIFIADVVKHPDYEPALRRSDVAVLRLERPADVNLGVRPACLYTDQDGAEEGLRAIASGWVADGHWQTVDGRLQDVVLPIRTARSCERAAREQGVTLDLQLHSSQLCAGGLCGNDTYPGDLGSPLQVLFKIVDDHRLYRIVGLASNNAPCGSQLPDLFTRVSSFVPWIESVVWPSG